MVIVGAAQPLETQGRQGQIAPVSLAGGIELGQEAAAVGVEQAAIVLIDPPNIILVEQQGVRGPFKPKAPIPLIIDRELALGQDIAAGGVVANLAKVAINGLKVAFVGIACAGFNLAGIEPLAPF